jgi:hypothetical protein
VAISRPAPGTRAGWTMLWRRPSSCTAAMATLDKKLRELTAVERTDHSGRLLLWPPGARRAVRSKNCSEAGGPARQSAPPATTPRTNGSGLGRSDLRAA